MILLTGANGVVGYPLRSQLSDQGFSYFSVSRNSDVSNNAFVSPSSLNWDLERSMPDTLKESLSACDTLIHCAPIWLLPKHLNSLKQLGIKRLIVFSSTSVLSKQGSVNIEEQKLVSSLADAERAIQEFCAKHTMKLTILRPSMIYGYGRDQNVMQIANFIRKFGFMVLVGKAQGERQPVHAGDLVQVCLSILENPITYGKAYNLAGGEVLTYRRMVERIFSAMMKKPMIVSLPLSVYRFGLRIAARLTSFAYTPEMADRMNENLIYSYEDAIRDFAFQPRLFLQNPQQDLGVGRTVGSRS